MTFVCDGKVGVDVLLMLADVRPSDLEGVDTFGDCVGVLWVTVDVFGTVNDTLGVSVEILQNTPRYLSEHVHPQCWSV